MFARNFDGLLGVALRLNSNDIIISRIITFKLNFTDNQFIDNGGGINILGTFQKSCLISVTDSYVRISLTVLDLAMDLLSIAL